LGALSGSGALVLYFDFIDSASTNAIAFRRDEYAFIGVSAGQQIEAAYLHCGRLASIVERNRSPEGETA
jgi:hypothetical protein